MYVFKVIEFGNGGYTSGLHHFEIKVVIASLDIHALLLYILKLVNENEVSVNLNTSVLS